MTITKSTTIRKELAAQLTELYRIVRSSKGVIVTGHVNPDGDNLGSQLALIEFMENAGIPCMSVNEERIPELFEFLPLGEKIRSVSDARHRTEGFDLMIVVDSGDFERIGKAGDFRTDGMKVVNIDHHQANELFGDVNIIDTGACSIGEMLYYFFKLNGIPITRTMAVNLYISIVTDTGSFKYDQMHPAVHLIASDLMELGVTPWEYTPFLYQNKTAGYVRLMEKVLSRVVFEDDETIVYSSLDFHDMKESGCFDTEGLIDYLGMVKSVSVFILIKEKEPGVYSVSLRSKHGVNVSEVALAFGGGGHIRAAGFKTDGMAKDDLIAKLLELIRRQKRF